MITKLPRWVWIGAWVLAFVAGVINVVGLLGLEHETITHLTGNTSRLSAALANLDGPRVLHITSLIGSFVLGTVVSGLLIEDTALRLHRNYGTVLLLESLLLFLAVRLLKSHDTVGLYAAACACGLQNAMVTTYSGAVIRTTHLSGMFTDLGISLGHAMRGLPVNSRRLSLCAVIISGFLVGGVAGVRLYQSYDFGALLLPAGLTLVVAASFGVFQSRHEPASPAH